jgi:hypothetical protein
LTVIYFLTKYLELFYYQWASPLKGKRNFGDLLMWKFCVKLFFGLYASLFWERGWDGFALQNDDCCGF